MAKINQTKSTGRGGARKGAGRKPGTSNKKTQLIAEKAAKGGITPIEFMLKLMRDKEAVMSERFEAAKAAAPYIHPRLAAVEISGDPDHPLELRFSWQTA